METCKYGGGEQNEEQQHKSTLKQYSLHLGYLAAYMIYVLLKSCATAKPSSVFRVVGLSDQTECLL